MKTGLKNYAASNDGKDWGDLECTVAIKEMKVSSAKKTVQF